MSAPRIEHVNITVTDPERSAQLLQFLFGWSVRWRGLAQNGGAVIHVGSEADYIALYGKSAPPASTRFAKGEPLNHIGIEVDDLAATEALVIGAGLEPFSHGDYEPGHRFYFFDHDGIEYEIVSYRGANDNPN